MHKNKSKYPREKITTNFELSTLVQHSLGFESLRGAVDRTRVVLFVTARKLKTLAYCRCHVFDWREDKVFLSRIARMTNFRIFNILYHRRFNATLITSSSKFHVYELKFLWNWNKMREKIQFHFNFSMKQVLLPHIMTQKLSLLLVPKSTLVVCSTLQIHLHLPTTGNHSICEIRVNSKWFWM